MKGRVVVGMSGGVDSSVSAALLQRDGYEVIGIHLVFWPHCSGDLGEGVCCGPEALEDSRKVAESLGIRFLVEDVSDFFRERVMDYFICEYRNGRTPNPCVICNRFVKFDAMLKRADELGAGHVATGHYAGVSRGYRYRLLRSVDTKYDQTYFLVYLTQDQLSRVILPLGKVQKARVREIAGEMGLGVHDRRSSQDVCFIQGRDYREFLREEYTDLDRRGDVVDTSGKKIGEHDGIACYTVGQRHGLGIGGGRPLYVISIDPFANILVLGGESELYGKGMLVDECNWIAFGVPPATMNCTVKVRYGNSEERASLSRMGGKRIEVVFDEPQRAIAPGQVAVFYRGEEVLGGGIIEKSF